MYLRGCKKDFAEQQLNKIALIHFHLDVDLVTGLLTMKADKVLMTDHLLIKPMLLLVSKGFLGGNVWFSLNREHRRVYSYRTNN